MAKFLTDDEMSQLEATAPAAAPKAKKIISDDEMAQMEADAPTELDSGARGAVQGATMGFADEISGGVEALWNKAKGDPAAFGELYKKYRDESRANFKKAEEANPKSYMAGQVGGAVASAAIPGMGGATLGKLALQGAAQGLGSSEADLTEGDVTGALKDTAIGAGTGAAIGGIANKATPYLAKGASKLASGASELLESGGNTLKNLGGRVAENATGATGRQAAKFAPGAGRELLERGIVGAGDTAENIAQKSSALREQAGRGIGEALDALDQKGVTASVDNVVAQLESQIDELAKTPGNERLIRQLQGEVDNLYNRGASNIPISESEIAKRNFQEMTNYNSPLAEQKASGRMAKAFREETERAAEAADPSIAAKFKEDKRLSGLLAPVEEAATNRALVNQQQQVGNLLDMAAGAYGLSDPDSFSGKAALAFAGRRFVAPRVASTVAKGLYSTGALTENLSKMVAQSPQMFGKFARPLQEAAKRGGNSLAATHFVLQQTQPEYRQMTLQGEESKDEQEDQ